MSPKIRTNVPVRLVVPLLLLCALPVYAQNRTFKWSDELCDLVGIYNAKKYTQAQLRNTLRLWDHGNFTLVTSATVFKPEDLPTLDVASLEKEYRATSAELAALDIVRTPYWETLRTAKLAELKQVYELSRLTIQGHKNPNILNELAGSDSCKTKYAVPLIAGGDMLLQTWRTVNEESRTKNADPERLRRIFEEQYASPDRMKFALVEVMTFGWWNCANESIKYVVYNGSQEKEFKKLFVRVRMLHCDAP